MKTHFFGWFALGVEDLTSQSLIVQSVCNRSHYFFLVFGRAAAPGICRSSWESVSLSCVTQAYLRFFLMEFSASSFGCEKCFLCSRNCVRVAQVAWERTGLISIEIPVLGRACALYSMRCRTALFPLRTRSRIRHWALLRSSRCPLVTPAVSRMHKESVETANERS